MQKHIIVSQTPDKDFVFSREVLFVDNRAVEDPHIAYSYVINYIKPSIAKKWEQEIRMGISNIWNAVLYKELIQILSVDENTLSIKVPEPDKEYTYAVVRYSNRGPEYFHLTLREWKCYNSNSDIDFEAFSSNKLYQEIAASKFSGGRLLTRKNSVLVGEN